MSTLEALFLGAVQGLTEFLPVSSSGHLVILERFLGIKGDYLLLNVLLHAGSLCALLVLFRRTIKDLVYGLLCRACSHTGLLWAIVGATIPTGIIGILLEERVKRIGIGDIGLFYFLTAALLFSLRYLKGLKGLEGLSFRDGFIVGICQGMGVFPGLSRSGVTIFGGVFAGLTIDSAVKFSFLLSIPTIAGALLIELKGIRGLSSDLGWSPLIVGFLSSFFFSLFAMRFLLSRYVQRKIHWFSLYCLVLGFILVFLK